MEKGTVPQYSSHRSISYVGMKSAGIKNIRKGKGRENRTPNKCNDTRSERNKSKTRINSRIRRGKTGNFDDVLVINDENKDQQFHRERLPFKYKSINRK